MNRAEMERFEQAAKRSLRQFETGRRLDTKAPRDKRPAAQVSISLKVTLGVSRRPTALVNYLFSHTVRTPFRSEAIRKAEEAAYEAGWGKVCYVHDVEELP